MSHSTIAIPLSDELGLRLEAVAKRTGRSQISCATEAIARHLEDMEDTFLAMERLENPGRRYSLSEAKEALGLED